MNLQFLFSISWLIAAGMLGFGISSVFSGNMKLSRNRFLIPYVSLVAIFLVIFSIVNEINLGALLVKNWAWGVVGALLVGAFVVRNVFSQPASARLAGFPLAFELLWSGVLYGLIDSLLLSVLPVLAAWNAFTLLGWTANWPGKVAVGAIAFLASLYVTICYHLGFPEYRSKRALAGPAIGNGLMSLGYLLTNNPMAAIFSHIAMHIAGVLRGPATVMQLPPHY